MYHGVCATSGGGRRSIPLEVVDASALTGVRSALRKSITSILTVTRTVTTVCALPR
jgi:hypothetical protein